jgi:transposase
MHKARIAIRFSKSIKGHGQHSKAKLFYNKNQGMKYQLIYGVDPSKKSFNYKGLNMEEQDMGHGDIVNQYDDCCAFIEEILDTHSTLKASEILFCIEQTGSYVNALVYALSAYGISIWLEDAYQLKQSMGRVRGKTDAVDAARIAKYACRNIHDVKLLDLPSVAIVKLRSLDRQRKRLLKSQQSLGVAIKEEQHCMQINVDDLYDHSELIIEQLRQAIKNIEQQIQQLIDSDQQLSRLQKIALSVPGIGPVNARMLIILTEGFTKYNDARKFASSAGIVPFEKQSGTSIKFKPRTSSQANREMKSLLTMAARSVIKSKSKFAHYYAKKREEGKQYLVVINALRNKIVRTVFACVRNDRFYEENFINSLQKP